MACWVLCDSLWPHRLWPTRLLCPRIFQTRILEWVAISYSRASSQLRDWTCISCASCVDRCILSTAPPGNHPIEQEGSILSIFYKQRTEGLLSDCRKVIGASVVFVACFLFLFLFFIELQLLYNVVLVSTVQQSESAIRIYVSPLLDFLPIRTPRSTVPGQYTGFSLVIYFIHSINSVCTYICICQSQSPNSSHSPFPDPLGVHMFVLYVCVSISVLHIRSSVPFF